MPGKSRYPWLVAILVSVVFLAVVYGASQLIKKEKERNLALQEELNDVKAKQKISELKLEESKAKISEMETGIQNAQIQIDSLSSLLEQEKKARAEALAQIDELKASLDEQKQLRERIEESMKKAQSEVEKLQAQVKEFDSRKNDLETRISELETKSKGVELGTIVVGSDKKQAATAPAKSAPAAKKEAGKQNVQPPAAQTGQSPAAPEQPAASTALEGRLLVVNKDYNFVVINLGSKDGISVGQMFTVYSGDKETGEIKVEKVHDSMAAAGFVNPAMKDKVREGDKIIPKNK
jgi:predicted RND superfamily exporter protein